mmetsp:Transcript_1721/g.3263  ORF Transcript_1721/g.3263 Transcript_1721/m.3263 type:complete len:211 (+) Transcript_1721:101-733(+)
MGRILGTVALMTVACFGAWSRLEKQGNANLQQSGEIGSDANVTGTIGSLMEATETRVQAKRDWEEDAAYEREESQRLNFVEAEKSEIEDSRQKKNAYWKLGIAFGVVCCLMASLLVLYAQMNKDEDRFLEGGTEDLQVAHCTWLCPCTADGHPLPPDDHPKLRLTDEDSDDIGDHERKEETVPLVGGAASGVSIFTLLYGYTNTFDDMEL